MLFNTYLFFLGFLPLTLAGYFLLSKYSVRLSIVFLFIASTVFYGYWYIHYLPLLLGSICVNYLIGQWISARKSTNQGNRARFALITGLAFNLGLLAFFKYVDFFGKTIASLFGVEFSPMGVVLPIGISFFTFTQIAYLVDCFKSEVSEYKPENYGLFVTYFPHLIAGPILHHKEMMPQFDRLDSHIFFNGRLVVGMLIFLIGLFKKVVLADGVARFVSPVFDVSFASLTMLEAWCGALAYTFQLYFDFSAYSDMAYGLSYMFGIVLPINFNSPYKAVSIIDFWRRWHITLSNFLRDYLYIPLGGNRHGSIRRHLNLMITMLLGGLWHGANWTFVVWGGLHGFYLACNHVVRRYLGEKQSWARSLLGWVLTFIAVVVAWVFFRSNSMDVALDILRGMMFGTYTNPSPSVLLGVNRIMDIDECLIWLSALAVIAFFLPNSYDLIGQGLLVARERKLSRLTGGLVLGLSVTFAMLLLAISETRGVSEFLYFNF